MIKKLIILGTFIALLTVGGVFAYVSQKKPVVKSSIASIVESKPVEDCSVTDESVITALNSERAKIGVTPVVKTAYLDKLADQRALELNGVLDNHAGFLKLHDNFQLDYYHYNLLSEELGLQFGCNNSVQRLAFFQPSPKHWTSLMKPTQDAVGIGFYANVLVIELGDLR